MHLLAEARGVLCRSLRQQLRHDADPLLAQHRVKQRAHAVLDVLGREDAVALRGVVDAVARAGNALERAVVVLRLYFRLYEEYHGQAVVRSGRLSKNRNSRGVRRAQQGHRHHRHAALQYQAEVVAEV